MMGRIKEFRGQKIIAGLTVRLVPPNQNYPDCVCMLVLTSQHLYVLEDNFDGTYEVHFEFVLREIDNIESETWEKASGLRGGGGNLPTFATILVYWVSVMFSLPAAAQNRAVKLKYVTIYYHTDQGKKEKLYFHMLDSAKHFQKAFEKAKAAYIQGMI